MEGVTAADSPIYRDLMRFKPDGWTANAWAVNAGVSRTVWTDMRRHGNPSRRTLEKLLAAAGSSLAEFEALRIGDERALPAGSSASLSDSAQSWRPVPCESLPLIASCAGPPVDLAGTSVDATELNSSNIIDQIPRPPALAADRQAYAFMIVGNSMWPRFRPGRKVAVSPAAEVVVGDDVVLTIRENPAAGFALVVLGELIDADNIRLRQFNPDATYSIDGSRNLTIHKIVGELI
jgi:SOS-response transcriptional repressor LexA